ncbi:MAG: response regulator transcription factor [Lachnospiraceae bacterium]|nr:response regulator transcription factor [Lachnospiraceae bacterium]
MTRVVVVDDFRLYRQFFEMYVKSSSAYELEQSCSSAEQAVEWCESHTPDLIIMDILMRTGIDGITAAEKIKRKKPSVKIILATSTAEATWEKRALMAGVEAFWYKEYSETSLLEIMDRVMAGEHVYPSESPNLSLGQATREDFTERELDVLRELTAGYTNEGIAERLGISVNTVRFHIQNLLSKTGFESRLDLAMNARADQFVVSEHERLLGQE